MVRLAQNWTQLTFLHWPVAPDAVAHLLPPGTLPDTHEGLTYVGLVPFQARRTGLGGLPGVPYFGDFAETNVRLYSVDELGRQGVVFLSLDAARLLPVLIGRTAVRLPYVWSRMQVEQRKDVIRYVSHRRWPRSAGSADVRLRAEVRIGARIVEPSPLEDFLTARWGLHTVIRGRTRYLPNEHEAWPLYSAELSYLDETLLAAAGVAVKPEPPVSVLYSPGVAVRFGSLQRP